MARATVRGLSRRWSHQLFGFALVPDLIFYLDVIAEELVHRVFQKNTFLDYYESGADLGLSDDMYESFIIYQRMMTREFHRMQERYNLILIDGNNQILEINTELQNKIDDFLNGQ